MPLSHVPDPNRVVLVGCGSKKKASGVHQAKDLYTSTYFELKRQYAEAVTPSDNIGGVRQAHNWWIVSAEHGVLHPTDEIEPYDTTMEDLTEYEKGRWVEEVKGSLKAALSIYNPELEVVLLAGQEYADLIEIPDYRAGTVRRPLQQCSGIGKQMQWLKEQIREHDR